MIKLSLKASFIFVLGHPCTERRACHLELACPPVFVPQTVGRRRGGKNQKIEKKAE